MRRVPWRATAALLGWIAGGVPAVAGQVEPVEEVSLLGEPVVDIVVEQEGRRIDDTLVEGVIESRRGAPLSMADVRATTEHLMSLNRFNDVQPMAEVAPGGVRLRYVLFPLYPVDSIDFTGTLGLPEEQLHGFVVDRYGPSPTRGRAAEIATALQDEYRRYGYASTSVDTRVVERRNPARATLFFDVRAGRRLPISPLRFNQVDDAGGRSTIDRVPDIEEGEPYDEPAILEALRNWEDDMQAREFYEARATFGSQFTDDGVFVSVNLRRGPRVAVRFTGDPLPASERDRLVPVRVEGSADEDLLEDSRRAIEAWLRGQGYRDAVAPYARESRDGELVITFDVRRGPRFLVRDLEVTGRTVIPEIDLLPLVAVGEGGPFVPADLARTARDVERLYRLNGFTQVAVDTAVTELAPDRVTDPSRQVDVRVAITEGPRTLVREVRFEGNTAFDDAALASLTTVAAGRPYSEVEIIADRDRLDLAYRDRGYELVRVDPIPEFLEGDTGARVRFVIEEGTQTLVDQIIIVGNERISAGTIDDQLLLREGEPLGYSARLESRARLAELGLFRQIRVEPLGFPGEPQRDVIVEVDEAPPTVLGVSGGVEGGFRRRPTGTGRSAEERFELAPRVAFEIGRRNLWGKNRSVNLFTRASLRSRDSAVDADGMLTDEVDSSYGLNEYRVVGTYREPRAFGSSSEVLATGIVEQAIRSSFNFRRRELRAQAGFRLSPIYSVSGLYSFQHTSLFDEQFTPDEEPLIDRLFPQVRLSKVSASFIRDSRDDVLDASRDTLFIVDADLAARAIGSEVGFARTFVQGFYYTQLPVPRRMVLALGARLGAAHGFPRDVDGQVVQDLPASERFFAGGDTSVRGFSLDRLGNEDTITASGFPTGGNGVVVLNSELRVRVIGSLQAAAFVDAGNVFPRASDLDLTDLRPSAGFGLMYQIGGLPPLRVDLGFNLDPRELVPGTPERRHVLHILLGQAF
jgi:outer membrane protein assembly factor BamA